MIEGRNDAALLYSNAAEPLQHQLLQTGEVHHAVLELDVQFEIRRRNELKQFIEMGNRLTANPKATQLPPRRLRETSSWCSPDGLRSSRGERIPWVSCLKDTPTFPILQYGRVPLIHHRYHF